jgi:hypothetical protein
MLLSREKVAPSDYQLLVYPSGDLVHPVDGKRHSDAILRRNLRQLADENKWRATKVHLLFESPERTTLTALTEALLRIKGAAPDCEVVIYVHPRLPKNE